MFPISDSITSNKLPILTLIIIGANLVIFYIQLTSGSQMEFISDYALIPSEVNFFNLESLLPFITSMFLHGGFFHIASNMWFLWIFGDDVEAHLGFVKYLIIYFLAGIVGGMTQYLLNPESGIPMIGASGAVSGVLASYMVLFPHSKIKTVLLVFFFVTITQIPAVIYIFYWFIIQLFSGILSLPFSFATGGVAFWAHVGGFIAGLYLTRQFKNAAHKAKREYIEGEIVE